MKNLFYRIFLVLLLLLLVSNVNAQNQKEQLNESYISYFNAERETIYLHVNKHTFLINEAIWFKGYVFDKKGGIPFLTTSNVYITLYDKEGNKVKTNLYYAENGTFHGQFEIDSNTPSGHYFFKAHTNWMKNFVEDESFTSRPIEIINPILETSEDPVANSTEFDLQFLPEGGHSISNTTNSIAFKIINCQGKGISVEGNIVNSKNEIVKPFKSNKLGFGKIDLKMEPGESYIAKYTLSGKDFETALPQAKPNGFGIAVNNYTTKDLTYITLKTNKETLNAATGKTYHLVIQQNQKNSIISLDIDKLDTKHIIPVDNKSLPTGVNTITLFNDQIQPVLERLFFNHTAGDFLTANLNVKSVGKDSIPVQINIKDNKRYAFSSNLSVSVLPYDTETFDASRNIITSCLIDPYINGTIENADFYFDDLNRIKSYHLDLVLITQGWSKYKWENIQNKEPNLIIPFEKGLTIDGTLNEDLDAGSKYEVQMFSMVNNINETRTVGRDKTFSFANYFILDSTKVHFSVLKDGQKITKPKLYSRVINKSRASLNGLFDLPSTCEIDFEPLKTVKTTVDIDYEGEVLDTINVYGKKGVKKKSRENSLKYIGDAFSKGIKVDKTQERTFPFIVDIINANGFIARNDAGRISIFNRQPVSFTSGGSPLLIIDGVNFGRNYEILTSMRTEEIDEIYFNKLGNGYGVQGGAGVIRIYLKKSLGVLPDKSLTRYANSLLVSGGFAKQKEFYTPLFYNKSTQLFDSYSAIDWKPELITDRTGTVDFKIKNTGNDKLLFIIEGFSVNGKLISEVKKVDLDNIIEN
ncbi:MAG: hypothetical protein HRU26_01710 [Psychroserpens sp.]|nr:hypothetical protein [Psychroserpens sp.]